MFFIFFIYTARCIVYSLFIVFFFTKLLYVIVFIFVRMFGWLRNKYSYWIPIKSWAFLTCPMIFSVPASSVWLCAKWQFEATVANLDQVWNILHLKRENKLCSYIASQLLGEEIRQTTITAWRLLIHISTGVEPSTYLYSRVKWGNVERNKFAQALKL